MPVSVLPFIATAVVYCHPVTNGGDATVGHCLPHLPPNSVATPAVAVLIGYLLPVIRGRSRFEGHGPLRPYPGVRLPSVALPGR